MSKAIFNSVKYFTFCWFRGVAKLVKSINCIEKFFTTAFMTDGVILFCISQVNTRLKQIWAVPIMLSEPNKFYLGHDSFLTGWNMTGQTNFRPVLLAHFWLVKMVKTSKAAKDRLAKYFIVGPFTLTRHLLYFTGACGKTLFLLQ